MYGVASACCTLAEWAKDHQGRGERRVPRVQDGGTERSCNQAMEESNVQAIEQSSDKGLNDRALDVDLEAIRARPTALLL